jgi:hypothetical protein
MHCRTRNKNWKPTVCDIIGVAVAAAAVRVGPFARFHTFGGGIFWNAVQRALVLQEETWAVISAEAQSKRQIGFIEVGGQ